MRDLLLIWPGGYTPPLLGQHIADFTAADGEALVRFRRGPDEGIAFEKQVIRLGRMRPDLKLVNISPAMGTV